MEKYLDSLKKLSLFKGLDDKEILFVCNCLGARVHSYEKDEAIFFTGEEIKEIGILLKGILRIEKEDIRGNLTVVEELSELQMFGEAFVLGEVKKSPVSVWAKSKAEVIFIDYNKLIKTCPSSCSFHNTVIKNMLRILAEKLILINAKLNIVQKSTIREKLMSFFEYNAQRNDSTEFDLPFNKTHLAEYLGINRSAMSRELSNMKDAGLIEINKNKIKLL